MVRLAALALYDRGHFSRGNARRTFGYEAYHWAIVIMPETSRGRNCSAFDATDSSEIDPATFRLNNPTMNWWYRTKENVNPELSVKLLGRIVIGQVPDGLSHAELKAFFGKVPLPVKNTHPQQSCVTWAVDAIHALQQQGWAPVFNLDQFKDWALTYADERMQEPSPREPVVRYHYS